VLVFMPLAPKRWSEISIFFSARTDNVVRHPGRIAMLHGIELMTHSMTIDIGKRYRGPVLRAQRSRECNAQD
jgi:hypothetical protein